MGDYPGLSRWTSNAIISVLIRGSKGRQHTHRRGHVTTAGVGWGNWEVMQPGGQECWQPLEGCGPAHTWIGARGNRPQTPASWTETEQVSVFNHQVYVHWLQWPQEANVSDKAVYSG